MKTDSLHTVADFLFVRFHNTLIFSVYSTSGNLAIAQIAMIVSKDVIALRSVQLRYTSYNKYENLR